MEKKVNTTFSFYEGLGVFRVRGGFWKGSGGLLARGLGRVAPPKA